jgi:hypothetical protein
MNYSSVCSNNVRSRFAYFQENSYSKEQFKKTALFFTGCKTSEGRSCVFPYNYLNNSIHVCSLDKRNRANLQYHCPTAFHDGKEQNFEICNQLCPVECERDETYNCHGECIPFSRPCNGNCLGKVRLGWVRLGKNGLGWVRLCLVG